MGKTNEELKTITTKNLLLLYKAERKKYYKTGNWYSKIMNMLYDHGYLKRIREEIQSRPHVSSEHELKKRTKKKVKK